MIFFFFLFKLLIFSLCTRDYLEIILWFNLISYFFCPFVRLLSRTSSDGTSTILRRSTASERAWFPWGMVISLKILIYCLVYMNYKKINKIIFVLFVLLLVLALYIFSWIFEAFTFIVTALQLCAVAALLTSVAATPPSFSDRASCHASSSKNSYSYVIDQCWV